MRVKNWFLALSSLLVLGILTVYFGTGPFILNLPVTKPSQVSTVQVNRGDSYHAVLRRFQAEGWELPITPLKIYFRLYGADKSLQTGEIDATGCCQTVDDLLSMLSEGNVVTYSVTIDEGHTVYQLLKTIKTNQILKKQVQATNGKQLAAQMNSAYDSMEGLLMPETYYFSKSDSDLDILKRANQDFWAMANELWLDRTETWFSDIYQAIILASIIEKEARFDNERTTISSVYLNRLKINMKLDADPTVIYGLGEKFEPPLFRKHLKVDTIYNTYLYKGLPPSPISTVSKKSMYAALNPIKSEFFFFVANAKGQHIFAKDYPEHLRNVAMVRKAAKLAAKKRSS